MSTGRGPALPAVVAHFRLEVTRRILLAIVPGVVLMSIGLMAFSVALYVGRVGREGIPPAPAKYGFMRAGRVVDQAGVVKPWRADVRAELGWVFAGLLGVAGGGLVTLAGLHRIGQREDYLLLRTDGALFQRARKRSFIAWEDVEAVRYDRPTQSVHFQRHDGTRWIRSERFSGIDGAGLADRAAEVRRKALFGLL